MNKNKISAYSLIMAASRGGGGGGSAPVIESKTITENGTYTVPAGVDGFNPVVVDVSGGGGDIEIPVFTGNQLNYFLYNGTWDWFVEKYGDKIETSNISILTNFAYNSKIHEIPFTIHWDGGQHSFNSLFNNVKQLRTPPYMDNVQVNNASSMFTQCPKLNYIPDDYFDGVDFSPMHSSSSASLSSMFNGCQSLKSIPSRVLQELYVASTSYNSQLYFAGFSQCYVLDELVGIPVNDSGFITSNAFNQTFNGCCRLKRLTFKTKDDGTPKYALWARQTIDLSASIGYTNTGSYITQNTDSHGLDGTTCIIDERTYARLKNNPNAWVQGYDIYSNGEFSRYNHDSAVETLNSLPNVTGAQAYGACTIKFKGSAGELTDGGAINTLTEAEIAVAAAKGWTVTLV